MTHNSDPSTNPSNLLTDSQHRAIAIQTVRAELEAKDRTLRNEVFAEIATFGKLVMEKLGALSAR